MKLASLFLTWVCINVQKLLRKYIVLKVYKTFITAMQRQIEIEQNEENESVTQIKLTSLFKLLATNCYIQGNNGRKISVHNTATTELVLPPNKMNDDDDSVTL